MDPKTRSVDDALAELETKRRAQEDLYRVTKQIHAVSMDEVLLNVKEDVQSLLQCERVTIYIKERNKEEIYSKVKDGDEVKEIRLPVNTHSIAGWVAVKKKGLRLRDAYDQSESKAVDPQLEFDSAWDKKTGFRTRQCIAVPVMREGHVHGVIQAINTIDGQPFNEIHEAQLLELADSLAVAFHNQKRSQIRSSKFDHLLLHDVINQDLLDKALAIAQKENQSPEYVLIQKFDVPFTEVGKSLSDFHRVPFRHYEPGCPIPMELVDIFTMGYLKHHLFVPLEIADDSVTVLMANTRNLTLLDDIQRKIETELKRRVRLTVEIGIREDILNFIDEFYGAKTATEDQSADPGAVSDALSDLTAGDEEMDPRDLEIEGESKEDDEPIIRFVNTVIEQAFHKGASDIHIEPKAKKDGTIRLRLDGTCFNWQPLPKKHWRAVVSRIKIMANLDIAERRLPQDGKIRYRDYGRLPIELRVATIPTAGGMEDVVLRLLAASEPIPIEKLGMLPHNLERFKKIVEEPYGIILCVGPTGSGKTTTLHSALGWLNEPDVKIWTAEDPVEITQEGLRQVNVIHKIGLTFERALRAFLRLDPDIIMIGEMRDLETAGAAIEASLTGHLVFSTLHTNNAPETVTRLLDMELDPYTFGDSCLGVLAQRLVRTLCKNCKKTRKPTDEEWEMFKREFGDEKTFAKIAPKKEDCEVGEAKGCNKCNMTGYKGRMGIHELMIVNDEMRLMIYRKAKSSEIRDLAVKGDMTMLRQDGVVKVMQGFTDMNEVRSVCIK